MIYYLWSTPPGDTFNAVLFMTLCAEITLPILPNAAYWTTAIVIPRAAEIVSVSTHNLSVVESNMKHRCFLSVLWLAAVALSSLRTRLLLSLQSSPPLIKRIIYKSCNDLRYVYADATRGSCLTKTKVQMIWVNVASYCKIWNVNRLSSADGSWIGLQAWPSIVPEKEPFEKKHVKVQTSTPGRKRLQHGLKLIFPLLNVIWTISRFKLNLSTILSLLSYI